MILSPYATLINEDTVHIVGIENAVIGEDAVLPPEEHIARLGELLTLNSGRLNRLIFAFGHATSGNVNGDDDQCRIDWDSELALSYRPRTRGFLP